MKIPFHEYWFDHQEEEAVLGVLKSGWLTAGEKVKNFERDFQIFKGNDCYCIAVSSATAALELIIDALDLPKDAEILVPNFTFYATAGAVLTRGYKVRLIDIDPDTLLPNVEHYSSAISDKTKAIIVVHYGGNTPEMDELLEFTQKNNLYLIEDCAHAIETMWKNTPTGLLGIAGAFSFYPNKNITTGEGGMVVTKDLILAEKIKSLRGHGIDQHTYDRSKLNGSFKQYDIVLPGRKANLSDLQATLGIVQLKKIHDFHTRRKFISETYDAAFLKLEAIKRPLIFEYVHSAYHLYVLLINFNLLSCTKESILTDLIKEGVQPSIHYKPLDKMTIFKNENHNSNFEGSRLAYQSVISLPIFPKMTDLQVEYVINVFSQIIMKYLIK